MINVDIDIFLLQKGQRALMHCRMACWLWELDITGFAFSIYEDTFCFVFCGPLVSFVYIMKQVVEYMRG